jgi:putative membrane protein
MKVLGRLLIAWLVIAAAIGLAAALLDSVTVHGGLVSLLGVALIFALVHAILGPILKLLTLPITVVTLGLFLLVINGLLLAITAGISDNLDVGGPLGVIVAAAVISILESVLGWITGAMSRSSS